MSFEFSFYFYNLLASKRVYVVRLCVVCVCVSCNVLTLGDPSKYVSSSPANKKNFLYFYRAVMGAEKVKMQIFMSQLTVLSVHA